MREKSRRQGGFTLIELMMVVAMVGVLSTVAIPNFTYATFKAKRSEAVIALKSIYKAQADYYAEYDAYANSFDQLGWDLSGSEHVDAQTIDGPQYTYTIYSSNGGQDYVAIANGNIDTRDETPDILVISSQVTVLEP